jgi:hypothetical protein
MGLHLAQGLHALARPHGEFGRTGPCQAAGRGQCTVHASEAVRWRARHRCTDNRGGVQSVERELASGGQSVGQGGGGETD